MGVELERSLKNNGYTFPMDFLQKGATTIQSAGPLPPAKVIPLSLKHELKL